MVYTNSPLSWLLRCLSPVVCIIAVLLMGNVYAMQAQLPPDPIILTFRGDLWAWSSTDPALEQLTSWGLNEQVVLSPDGTKVAYLSGASIFADWLRTIHGGGGFTPPQNVWLLDIASRQTVRIADQPANAVWAGPGAPGHYLLRSHPTWSPDSQQLAWVELPINTLSMTNVGQRATWELILYDLRTQSATLLDSAPLIGYANPSRFNILWDVSGLTLQAFSQGFNALPEVRRYNPAGSLIEIAQSDEQVDFGSSSHENQELYSLSAPDGASFFSAQSHWYLTLPGRDPLDLGEQIQPFGISRDGSAVVYGHLEADPVSTLYAYTVVVQAADQVLEIGRFDTAQIVWGPMGWRMRP